MIENDTKDKNNKQNKGSGWEYGQQGQEQQGKHRLGKNRIESTTATTAKFYVCLNVPHADK